MRQWKRFNKIIAADTCYHKLLLVTSFGIVRGLELFCWRQQIPFSLSKSKVLSPSQAVADLSVQCFSFWCSFRQKRVPNNSLVPPPPSPGVGCSLGIPGFARDTRPLLVQLFFIFIQFLKKIGQSNKLLSPHLSLMSLVREILDPPLHSQISSSKYTQRSIESPCL